MSRERMITRTINETVVGIMCLNVETASVEIKEYHITGEYTTDEALKKCKKLYETDELKLVHIDTMVTKELLYGMPEEEFMKYAVVLPPRNINK